MILKQRPNLAALLLASCLSGIVLTPLLYIAIGALGGFSSQFSYIILPVYLLCGGYLLRRFYSSPTQHHTGHWGLFLEAICLLLVIVFLAVISGFRLLTTTERISLSAVFFLLTTTLSFPVIYLRATALLSNPTFATRP